MRVPCVWILAGVAALAASEAVAKSARWRIDFECQTLDRVLVPKVLDTAHQSWYCTYTITNNTGMDRTLALGFFVETDVRTGPPEHRRSERRNDVVDPAAQRLVEARAERRYLDSVQVQGRLRNAERKEGIAVFGPLSAEADVVTLYVTGLSSAVEESRLGEEYQKMIRSGTDVFLVERGKAGGYAFLPLPRRIGRAAYQAMAKDKEGKVPVLRRVTEYDGEVFYALDDQERLTQGLAPVLTATEPRRYLERVVLRRRYSRCGDEMQPQLDVYHLDSEDWILVLDPLPPAAP